MPSTRLVIYIISIFWKQNSNIFIHPPNCFVYIIGGETSHRRGSRSEECRCRVPADNMDFFLQGKLLSLSSTLVLIINCRSRFHRLHGSCSTWQWPATLLVSIPLWQRFLTHPRLSWLSCTQNRWDIIWSLVVFLCYGFVKASLFPFCVYRETQYSTSSANKVRSPELWEYWREEWTWILWIR